MAIDILIAGRLPPPNVLPQLEDRFRLHTLPRNATEDGAMLDEVWASIRGLLTNAAQEAPKALPAALPNLEIISSSGVGTDALNMEIAGAMGHRVADNLLEHFEAELKTFLKFIPVGYGRNIVLHRDCSCPPRPLAPYARYSPVPR